MENTLNKYTITWIEFRPIIGIATKDDCNKMKLCLGIPKQYNGYAYVVFPSKDSAIFYLDSLKIRRKLSKKYEVRLFTDAQFSRTDLSKSEIGKGYPIEFTDKQNEEMIIL